MNSITFDEALADLQGLLDKVSKERTPTVINRSDGEPIVLLSQSEFDGIQETLHLLSSPANAARLLESVEQLKQGKTKVRELIRDEESQEPEQAASEGERGLVDRSRMG